MAANNTTTVSLRVPTEWFPYLKTLPIAEICQDALLAALQRHCGKNAKLRETFAEGGARMQLNRDRSQGLLLYKKAKENRMKSKPHPVRSN